MAAEVLSHVLTFAERVRRWRPEDGRIAFTRAITMWINRVYPHHDHVTASITPGRRVGPLNDDQRAVTHRKLHPMIADPQAFCEAEDITQPCCGGANILIGEF